ncbi:MAG: PepSY domain-containing protein [Nocardioidaceae bacterium]
MTLPRKRLMAVVGIAGTVALGVGGVTVAQAGDGTTSGDDDGGGDHHIVGSIEAPPENEAAEDGNTSESDEAAQLQPLAKIDAQQAQAAALAAVSGTVQKVELGNDNGYVVYEVKVSTANGVVEVKVDAGNAEVLAQEADDEAEGQAETGNPEQESPESGD